MQFSVGAEHYIVSLGVIFYNYSAKSYFPNKMSNWIIIANLQNI